MITLAFEALATEAAAPRHAGGKIGPNAVIQLAETVKARFGWDTAAALFSAAGVGEMLDRPPKDMTDERIPAALYDHLWETFPDSAPTLAAEAGQRTADYVMGNRIPRPVQWLLKVLPRPLGARLLLWAIKKNAWTFVGSGHCAVAYGDPCIITVRNNPLKMPDCAWHCAVFERMFTTMIAAGTKVRHSHGTIEGFPVCRFEIDIPQS